MDERKRLWQKPWKLTELYEQIRPEEHEQIFWTEDAFLNEEDFEEKNKDAPADSDYEPLRMYLKEILNIPQLTKEGEIEIARAIEKGRSRLKDCSSSLFRLLVEKLLMLGDALRKGEEGLDGIIQSDLNSDEAYETERFLIALARIKELSLEAETDMEQGPGTVEWQ